MTEIATPTIEQAILALSDRCDGAQSDDGQGFNGRDAGFGNSLANRIREGHALTVFQRTAALKMLRTYRVQLQKYGIDYDGIVATTGPTVAEDLLAEIERIPFDQPPTPSGRSYVFRGTVDQVTEQIRSIPSTQTASYTARQILGPGGLIARQLPGYESREPQLQMAQLIERSLRGQHNAAIEAGTGVGKSLAYLIPAILASYTSHVNEDGSSSRRRTIVSTADKSLQAQLWLKDLPFLQSVMPQRFDAALLKGRGNYLCLSALDHTQKALNNPTMAGFGFESRESADHLPEVMAWATVTHTGDLEELPFVVSGDLREAVATDSEGCTGEHCPFHDRCWAERAKKSAKQADVIVVNHALLMRDLAVRLQTDGLASVLPPSDYVVLDEAHAIPSIAVDAFGAELTAGGWQKVVRLWERLTVEHETIAAMLKAQDENEDTVEAQQSIARCAQFTEEIEVFFAALDQRLTAARATQQLLGNDAALIPDAQAMLDYSLKMREAAPHWLSSGEDRERWSKLSKRIEAYVLGLLTAATPPARVGALVRYVERTGQGRFERLVLHVKPVDVSDLLREGLFESSDFKAVISTSATIATAGQDPFRFWSEQVGCDGAETLVVGSPFDYERNALLYLPPNGRDFDPSQSRQDGSLAYLDRLAAECERLILASRGRAFVLFTSFRTLNEVYSRLSPRLQQFLVLKQGEAPRPELVQRFRSDGNAVLFGVKSFWTGVDIGGEALSLVIIDKLPFAPPDDPVWEARKDAITRRTGDSWAWFHELAIPTAIIELKQGAGRLIRSASDRGTVALLDGRLTTKNYSTRIIHALPPMTRTSSLDAVKAFYGGLR